MKKLLLTLGAVASVAAPVAAVVACSSNNATNTTFDKDVKAYQALQVMAYTSSAKKLLVVKAPAGVTMEFKSATVFTDASHAAVGAGVVLTDAEKQAKLPIVKNLFDKVKADFEKVVEEIHKNKTKFSDAEKAGITVLTAIEAYESQPTITYDQTVSTIDTALNTFVDDKKATPNVSIIESLDILKAKSGDNLTDKESNLLQVGLPLMIKLAKTVKALEA